MESHNIKNFSFDAVVGKHASNQFRLWHFSREWRAGIITLAVFKFITWIVSVYSGYYFLYTISLPVVNGNKNVAVVSTLVLLILVELLTQFFLSKFFKFLYKGIIMTSVFAGVIACAIYFLSFYMSTNGLAMRQADKIDQAEVIIDNTGLEVQAVKEKFRARIADYRTEITNIKANPQGWRGGKRDCQTAQQLKDIKEFNLKIDDLEQQQKAEIAELMNVQKSNLQVNKDETTAEANRYYNYVFAIMIAQFIFNGLLMFAWSRIYSENNQLEEVNEDIKQAENSIMSGFFAHIASRLFEEADNIQKSINNDRKAIPLEITNPQPQVAGFSNRSNRFEPSDKEFERTCESSNPERRIGFQQSNSSNQDKDSLKKEFEQSEKQFERSSNAQKNSSNAVRTTTQPVDKKEVDKSTILGKLRTNDMLRYCIKRKDDGSLGLSAQQISNQCGVKRWKYFEFRSLMESAGMITESDMYKNLK